MTKHFFSCDWGSSMFRLKLVDVQDLSVIAEEKNNNGILATHEQWKNSDQDESQRLNFYLQFVQQQLSLVEQKTGALFKDAPLIISGMASSNLGMIEIPYQQLPIEIDGSDLRIHKIQDHKLFPGSCVITPGVCTRQDVMRGEEILLFGSATPSGNEEDLYIFPGTHSKHVIVKNTKAISIKTYMTGEFFDMLSTKTILSSSVKANNDFEKHIWSFEKGVLSASEDSLLHSSFMIRTNHLFSKYSPEQNYHYLSGLLIGSELSELRSHDLSRITLVANKQLSSCYFHALKTIAPRLDVETIDAEEALVKGQHKILKGLC